MSFSSIKLLYYLTSIFIFLANNLHLMEGTSTMDIINGDVFFEIVDPAELEYTYRIRPAKDFGAPFVSNYLMLVGILLILQLKNSFFRMPHFTLKMCHLCLFFPKMVANLLTILMMLREVWPSLKEGRYVF